MREGGGQKVTAAPPHGRSALLCGVREEQQGYFLGGNNQIASTPIMHSINTDQRWEWSGMYRNGGMIPIEEIVATFSKCD